MGTPSRSGGGRTSVQTRTGGRRAAVSQRGWKTPLGLPFQPPTPPSLNPARISGSIRSGSPRRGPPTAPRPGAEFLEEGRGRSP